MSAIIAELFAHGATGIWRDELQRGGFRSRRRHDDGRFHGAGLSQSIDDLGYGGALLADGDIDANDVAALLIDYGINGDGGFAGLAIAVNQLALTAADGN